MSDDITVKTSNVREREKEQKKPKDPDLQILDEQVQATALERQRQKRQKQKDKKKAQRRKAKMRSSQKPKAEDVWSMTEDNRLDYTLGIVLTQYSLKRGLTKFGKEGEKSAEKEMKQFVDYGCLSPIDPSTLSKEDKRKALRSFMFLKEKRDGELKSRAVIDGSTQRTTSIKRMCRPQHLMWMQFL